MKTETPDASLPRIWCDFNACGRSGAAEDDCYYAFDKVAILTLSRLKALDFLLTDGEVIGCEARLERFQDSWRIRPIQNTCFKGRFDEPQAI
jgi:hypothetical protein